MPRNEAYSQSSFSAAFEGYCFHGFFVTLCSCSRVLLRPYGAANTYLSAFPGLRSPRFAAHFTRG